MSEALKFKHPSYGNIRLSRVHGGASHFGANGSEADYIRLELRNSSYSLDDYGHRVTEALHDKDSHVATVEMTELQFARLISSIGHHQGADCTIIRRESAAVESDLAHGTSHLDSIMQAVQNNINQASDTVDDAMLRAEAALAEQKTTKKQLAEILTLIQQARRVLRDKTPYIVSVAEEHLRNVADAVKHDIASQAVRYSGHQNALSAVPHHLTAITQSDSDEA